MQSMASKCPSPPITANEKDAQADIKEGDLCCWRELQASAGWELDGWIDLMMTQLESTSK
jgi:hypothetical protein